MMTAASERARIRKRRAAAKERGRKLVEAARARARKIVEAARARARIWLDVALRPRVRLIVKEAKTSAKRRTKTTTKPKGKPKPMTTTSSLGQEALFRTALVAVSAQNVPGALLSVRDVREKSGLPKAVFDALALRLAAENVIVLHHHDFPASLSAAERAQLIKGSNGMFFVGMALRQPERESRPRDPKTIILGEVRAMGGTREKPVRIPALRKRLASALTQTVFDKTLGQLQVDGKVVLYRDDNNVTAETEGAWFVAGNPRHILYLR
jgi:hypothetical protein